MKGNNQIDKHDVLDCPPDVLLLVLPHIENKLAQESLQEFYGRQKIPMDPAATLSEHHAPVTNDGYVMHDRFIFLRIRSEPEILRVQRMKIQHHKFSDMTTIRLNNMWH